MASTNYVNDQMLVLLRSIDSKLDRIIAAAEVIVAGAASPLPTTKAGPKTERKANDAAPAA